MFSFFALDFGFIEFKFSSENYRFGIGVSDSILANECSFGVFQICFVVVVVGNLLCDLERNRSMLLVKLWCMNMMKNKNKNSANYRGDQVSGFLFFHFCK